MTVLLVKLAFCVQNLLKLFSVTYATFSNVTPDEAQPSHRQIQIQSLTSLCNTKYFIYSVSNKSALPAW